MHRRDALRALGGTVALSALSGDLFVLARELHAQATRIGELQVLDPHQNETVVAMTELIIPQTDTPGARAARVNEFIDLVLAEWCDDADRALLLDGLADVDARARALYGNDFVHGTEAQQAQILTALDQELALRRDAAKEGNTRRAQDAAPDKTFFHLMKRLTLVGYYTSEIGANQELHYQIIPGRYAPCFPLETGGR
jgi:hypothetical protein